MDNQNYIQFEAFLLNELTQEEVRAFEARLKNDSEFNQAFNTYKELSSFLEHTYKNETDLKAFKENLEKVSEVHFNSTEKISEKNKSPKIFNFYKYAIAASIALLFGVFIINQFSNPTYGDYANYDTISLTVRGSHSSMLQIAENAFNTKDFAKAEETFKHLLELDKENSELKFYRAISNIELDNFKIAEELLMNLRKGQSVYKNKAIWYLALSKLKQNNEKHCIEILKTIPKDAEDFKNAQKLLKKLD